MLGHLAIFSAGSIAVFAWDAGFFTVVLLSLLAPAWIGAEVLLRDNSRRGPVKAVQEPPPLVEREVGRWRAIVDQTPAPLITLTSGALLHAANRAARDLFKTDDRIPAPQDLVAELCAISGAESRVVTLNTARGPRAFALVASDIADDQGVIRLGVLTDIQSELHAAEAKALRDLLALLSHELMNSLTPVASLAEIAAEYLEGEPSPSARAAREAVVVLGRRAESLSRFVEGYRTLARLPPPRLRRTILATLLDDIAQMFRVRWTAHGVELAFSAAPKDLVADVDPDLITQALLNLLTNAAEAALENGSAPKVSLLLATDGGTLEFVVEDNGAGVADHLIDSVFHPFVTTKPNGQGIGLNLARQIALSHGGDLKLSSGGLGRGAQFRLSL